MEKIRVLVVDDSAFMRKSVAMILESDPQFEVVGYARDGKDALEKTKEFRPDLITMDVIMPVMDGIQGVQHIMAEIPTPILMLSSTTKEGEKETIESLEYGAVDFCFKDGLLEDEHLQKDFLLKCKLASNTLLKKTSAPIHPPIQRFFQPKQLSLIIIGSSTGGPSALTHIIKQLPKDFPVPILIVQHMAKGFTKPLAERFDSECALTVKEAERGDEIKKGYVYIAPADYQTTIYERDNHHYLNVSKDYSDGLYKPSVDVSVLSACQYFKSHLLVTILTGMGEDGLKGCQEVKANEGYVICESEETAVVYGMPKMVIDAGLADEQSPHYQIYERIRRVTF